MTEKQTVTPATPDPPVPRSLMAMTPCGQLGCTWRVDGVLDGTVPVLEGLAFVHHWAGRTATCVVPDAALRDPSANVFGDLIRPWLERLHQEEER